MPVRLGIAAFVSGVALLQWQPDLPAMYTALVLPLLLVVVVLCWRSRQSIPVVVTSRFLFLILLFGGGYYWAAGMACWRLADSLPKEWEGRDVQVIGVISSLPQQNDRKIRFQFDIEQILTPQAYVPKRLSLSWYQNQTSGNDGPVLPVLHAGERWQLTVRLKRPHSNANPHGFDYEAWALERNIRAVGYVRPALENQRLDVLVQRPAYWIASQRQQIQQRFNSMMAGHSYTGVLMTIATGDQRAIPSDQWQVFTRTGTNHLMAISGLHITLVSSLVYALVFQLWRSSARLLLYLPARRAAVIAGLIVAFAYALLSGFAIPAQRAFFMLAVVAMALWRGRMTPPSMVLAWALFLVILIDPWAVLSAGFWLSFGAIGMIMLVTVGRIGPMHWLAGWLRVQWAITLGLIPLLLALFQQVSLVSPVANAVAIPLVSLVVVPLTLLATIPLFEFLLSLAHSALSIVMWFLQWLNALPQPVWQQHAPPFWTIPVAIIGVVWLLLPGSLGLGFFSGFPARWLGIVVMLPLFLVLPPKPPEGALWLAVLDVGQGLAVVAQTHNHALLFDSGPAFGETDSGERTILPFLRAKGIHKLDSMIISHADSDHSGGALSILNAMPVGALLSSLDTDHPISQTALQSTQCTTGQFWQWDGVTFEILYPVAQIYRDPQRKTNASSCVLKITTAHGSVLIPADIGHRAERFLLDHVHEKLPSTVLIAPHHGSLTSSGVEFVQQVNPLLTIFTVGYRNRFGHPREEVVNRYRELGNTLLRSDWHGAVLLRLDWKGLSVESWRQTHPRYWQQREFLTDG
ncbi:DNA internalization-related competence protein ComEC/Rec2 [Nitrosomonas sp.]|uniref:DNA internalization-related competence protein ComEC/Rec2 n=1 Tax=Nitrosomonas sp. TaxID=42353 RepID=UPI0020812136|nr:DNA internalization-related competence protein ComEC/Rec2 [Nitrosomonas sp.]GJL75040.1 MAG: DNA internalization-related competence protein ComEC/Rec2 [Nitrosomonas sp.]